MRGSNEYPQYTCFERAHNNKNIKFFFTENIILCILYRHVFVMGILEKYSILWIRINLWSLLKLIVSEKLTFEPVHEETNNLGFQPGVTQIRLYSHRSRLEACNFGFKKKRDCTICVAKTKSLISCAVTAQLISVFVFACANCWFSHAVAHFCM